MGLLPAGASAATLHLYQSQLTGTPTGAGGTEVPFTTPRGLAVDGSDNLYVSDLGPGLIDKFAPSGSFLAQGNGEGHWTASSNIESLAFSDASDHLYAADTRGDHLWVLNPDTSFNSALTGPFESCPNCGSLLTAADNSGGSADGDVYVTNNEAETITRIDGAGAAAPFSAAAPYISGDQLTGTPAGLFSGNFGQDRLFPGGIAVDPSGDLYVANTQDRRGNVVYEYEPSGQFKRAITEVEGTHFSHITALAVDPTDGNLLVADSGLGTIFELGPSGELLGETTGAETPGGSFGGPSSITGLAVDSSGRLYVSDKEDHIVDVRVVDVFSRATVPDVNTGAASDLTGTAATLAGTVGPDGIALTDCRFEYVTEAAFEATGFSDLSSGGTAPCEPAFGSIPSSGETAVNARVSGLTPGITYRYRLLAANSKGAHPGRVKAIPTVIASTSVSDVTTSAATLNAQIDPLSLPTTYHFEYLPEQQYKADGESFTGATVIPAPDAKVPAAPLGTVVGSLEAGDVRILTNVTIGAFPVGATVTGPGIPPGTLIQGPQNGYRISAPATATVNGATFTVFAPVSQSIAGLSPETAYVYRVVATNSAAATGIAGPVRVFHTHPTGLDASLPDNRAYELVSPAVKDTGGGVLGQGTIQEATADGSAITYPGEDFFQSPDGDSISQQYTSFAGPAGWSTRNTSGQSREEAFAPLAPPALPTTPVLPAAATPAARVLEQTPDGSIVFFTDTGKLTPDSTAAPGEPDLYRYDVAGEQITDLSVDSNSGQHADVQGVLGAGGEGAEAGSYVYFVANGMLASGASPGNCSPEGGATALGGNCNLYLSHAGATTFIAVLSAHDNEPTYGLDSSFPEAKDWTPNRAARTAEVSPDGRYLAFGVADHALAPQLGGFLGPQVFRYGVATDTLLCASCNPDGATNAAVRFSTGAAGGPKRYLTDDGRLLFNDLGALSPRDVNGRADVYEFEDQGTGACQTPGGCRSLISGGGGTGDSLLAAVSGEGNDVFFITSQRLSSEDRDESLDMYDARVDGRTPPVPPPPCETGEACHGPTPPPPLKHTPGSTTFNGPEEGPDHLKKAHHKKKHHHKKHHGKRAGRNHGGQK